MAHNLKDRQRTEDIQLKANESIEFSALLLSPCVLSGLKSAGFIQPSPIQLEAIPVGRCGADLIVQAKSGTGKTCVFTVIALESVNTDCKNVQVLVLAPTREIVVQIYQVVLSLGCALPKLKCHYFIGGTPLEENKIKVKNCHIAIGTPGRIKQLIGEKALKTDTIRFFVLDEADKLLEDNFQNDINWIYHKLPPSKQMMALSATYPEALAQLLAKYMQSPILVRLNNKNPALIGVKQFYKITAFHPLQSKTFENKIPHLLAVLSSLPFGQCIIFSNYQMLAQGLSDRLNVLGWPATYICGKKEQSERLLAISNLRQFKCRVLVSTDLTARGIDIENVNLIVNLDVPWDLETYLHRIGRAGRFGSHGLAITFASAGDEEQALKAMIKVGNLAASPLPDKLDSQLWETAFSINENIAEESSTEDSANGNDFLRVELHSDRLPTSAGRVELHSDRLPMSAGRIELLKNVLNGKLEEEGLSRKMKRLAKGPKNGSTLSERATLEVEQIGIVEAMNALLLKDRDIDYGTYERDVDEMNYWIESEKEKMEGCGICRASEDVTVSLDNELESGEAIEDLLRKLTAEFHANLVEKITGKGTSDEFLTSVRHILDLPSSNECSWEKVPCATGGKVHSSTSDDEEINQFSSIKMRSVTSSKRVRQSARGRQDSSPVSNTFLHSFEENSPNIPGWTAGPSLEEYLRHVRDVKYSVWLSEYTKDMYAYRKSLQSKN